MADTLPDIELPANTWVDLYAASGIAVGTKIIVHNTCAIRVRLNESSSEPIVESGPFVSPEKEPYINDDGASGLWALCGSGGAVNVEVG